MILETNVHKLFFAILMTLPLVFASISARAIESAGGGQCLLPLQEPPPAFKQGDKKAFFDWLGPTAKYIESKTGLPGAQIMAQAGLETGYGTSNLFKKGKAIFGHSCFDGKPQSGAAKLGDTSVPWAADCSMSRPKAEGGRYLSFNTYADSIAAYAQLILEKGPYPKVRALVAKSNPPESPANPYETIKATAESGYAKDGSYATKLTSIVKTNNMKTPLQTADAAPGGSNTCQVPGNSPPKHQAYTPAPTTPKPGRSEVAPARPTPSGSTPGNTAGTPTSGSSLPGTKNGPGSIASGGGSSSRYSGYSGSDSTPFDPRTAPTTKRWAPPIKKTPVRQIATTKRRSSSTVETSKSLASNNTAAPNTRLLR